MHTVNKESSLRDLGMEEDINHNLSFNQMNHSSDKMTTGGEQQSCSSYNPVNPDSDNFSMTDKRLFAGVLDCFVPRNDERASDSDNFAMTAVWGMTDKRLFASVLDCFVPRNDESARDSDKKRQKKLNKNKLK
jgi:hypothetical protein